MNAPARRWLPGLLLGLVLFGLGFAAGGGTAAVVIGRRIQEAVREPERLPARAAQRLQRRHDLSDAERVEVEAVLRRHHERLRSLKADLRRQALPRWRALRQDLGRILGPARAPAFERRFDDLRRLLDPGVEAVLDGR